MFRCLKSHVFRGIALASLYVLAFPGCSQQEPSKVYEEPSANGSRAVPQPASPEAMLLAESVATTTPEESIRYVVPPGWSPTDASGLSKVSFEVKEGPLTAETAAMGLPGSATQLLPNVNLWRRQVGLEDTMQEDLNAALEPIEIDGRPGHYIKLVGPSDAERPLGMLAVLASGQDRTWFFKMSGDLELVLRQEERFEEFVRSVTFVPAGGDKHD